VVQEEQVREYLSKLVVSKLDIDKFMGPDGMHP